MNRNILQQHRVDQNPSRKITGSGAFKKLSLCLALGILLAGCAEGTQQVIQGSDLLESSQAIDEQNIENVIATQKEKYIKHYQDGLYFEDRSEYQKELNREFQKALRQQIDQAIRTDPEIKFDPGRFSYILKTDIEYVNESVKLYSEGKLSAQEIIFAPEHIMQIRIQFYGFEDRIYKDEEDAAQIDFESVFFEPRLRNYIDQGIENVEYLGTCYHADILKQFPIEEIEKQEDIPFFLDGKAKALTTSAFLKTYYGDTKVVDEGYVMISEGEVGTMKYNDEFIMKKLSQKYNIEFYRKGYSYYAPKDRPDLFFESLQDISAQDYFLSTLYQDILTKKIQKYLEQEGLSDRMVVFVEVEPDGYVFEEGGVSSRSYDMSKEMNEEEFLLNGPQGYNGSVNVILIDLDTGENPLSKERKDKIRNTVQSWVDGGYEYIEDKGGTAVIEGGFRYVEIKRFEIDDYGRKVVVDLFKRYRLTERNRRPNDLGLAGVWSDIYDKRAETPGFHYLDIFAKEEIIPRPY